MTITEAQIRNYCVSVIYSLEELLMSTLLDLLNDDLDLDELRNNITQYTNEDLKIGNCHDAGN